MARDPALNELNRNERRLPHSSERFHLLLFDLPEPMHSKDFAAWIVIGGQEAPEYQIVETSKNNSGPRRRRRMTCWIASDVGKRFTVHWTNKLYYHGTMGSVVVDGRGTSGSGVGVWGQAIPTLLSTLPKTEINVGVSNGKDFKPFVFSALELSEDDETVGRYAHRKLGTIELSIYPARVEAGQPPSIEGVSIPDIKMHESAKKAVDQIVNLGETEPMVKPEDFYDCEIIGQPLIVFLLQVPAFGSVLQANGIAPLPPRPKQESSVEPEPEPERAPTPNEALAEEARIPREKMAKANEETRTMVEKLAAVEAKMAKNVKRELEDRAHTVIDLTRRKRMKLEPTLPREVIDLT
ncbi:hypothetical protein DFH09DRAFT_1436854 [Mycena vulgaris]|nr:hypothetical protein DFH09DRAFT_1436854 [Mycena vulgaris]